MERYRYGVWKKESDPKWLRGGNEGIFKKQFMENVVGIKATKGKNMGNKNKRKRRINNKLIGIRDQRKKKRTLHNLEIFEKCGRW
ncbi:hypothetical protein GWI33_002987 [Rhynchophorus ferrugineus]|uniref:Uncharacterized protein n=1 Tax=Rhynchophorus ferrugineus TaxID=354439 RepID=A0A834MFA7_RHYFE|nr:hypothetical protein GWI33_002987 [Rhynchophorus ferrugineus]